MSGRSTDENDPDRVRERLRRSLPEDWHVFETVAADGSLAVGAARGRPDPSLVRVVDERLSESAARDAPAGLARWHRSRGRVVAGGMTVRAHRPLPRDDAPVPSPAPPVPDAASAIGRGAVSGRATRRATAPG